MFIIFPAKSKEKFICSLLVLLLFVSGLFGCQQDRIQAATPTSVNNAPVKVTSKLAEVAPPTVIQQLNRSLEQYQPQVNILSPQPNQVISESNLKVNLQVLNLPIFKNEEYEMGPHLQLILDNEPYKSIYDVTQPVTLENLSPGTHTIRVFAAKPWNESFKNDGAYAQTTFHVFTKSNDNNPNSSLPLLTYSEPKGGYGAEPIAIDYYLTNAPLHLVAQENSNDNINDWRIKVTVNGESFFVDTWQTIYLKGFKVGNNWVQLEFIDENGNEVSNAFNNTVRVINYQPSGDNTLSKIVRGELSAEEVKGIVDPNYKPVVSTPEIITPSEKIEKEITSETSPALEKIEKEITPKIITPSEEIEQEITPEIITPSEKIEEQIIPEIITPSEKIEEQIIPETPPALEETEEETIEEITTPSEKIEEESTIKNDSVVRENSSKQEPKIQNKIQDKLKLIKNFLKELTAKNNE